MTTQNIQQALQHKIDNKTKPHGALGELEALALKVGCIQNSLSPQLRQPTMLVFAADHGLADEKISPYPKDVTWQMAMNFVAGGAAISVFCRQNGIALKVIDAGVDYDFPVDSPIVPSKIARGSRNMRKEPAMTTASAKKHWLPVAPLCVPKQKPDATPLVLAKWASATPRPLRF